MVGLDIRQAIRSILRTPLFTGVVVLLLALGIGANALIFTAVDVLLLRPLPVTRPEQIVRLGVQRSPTHTSYEHPYLYARVLRERAHSFSAVFASWPMEMAFTSGKRVESITGNTVSGNYFFALGLTPVLGVVNDTKYRGMREIPPPTVYNLLDDDAGRFGGMSLHVSVHGNPASTIADLREMLGSVGPGLAPADVATMEQEIDTSLWQERLPATLSSLFALVSAVIAGLGLFGMLAYAVSRRTHEIGIRVAVGATAGRIAVMVGRDAASAVVPGLLLGLAAYAACSRVLAALLYGIPRWDAVSIGGATICLIAVSGFAAFLPAIRAAMIQPSRALRDE
jgi:hypothetical protein